MATTQIDSARKVKNFILLQLKRVLCSNKQSWFGAKENVNNFQVAGYGVAPLDLEA